MVSNPMVWHHASLPFTKTRPPLVLSVYNPATAKTSKQPRVIVLPPPGGGIGMVHPPSTNRPLQASACRTTNLLGTFKNPYDSQAITAHTRDKLSTVSSRKFRVIFPQVQSTVNHIASKISRWYPPDSAGHLL